MYLRKEKSRLSYYTIIRIIESRREQRYDASCLFIQFTIRPLHNMKKKKKGKRRAFSTYGKSVSGMTQTSTFKSTYNMPTRTNAISIIIRTCVRKTQWHAHFFYLGCAGKGKLLAKVSPRQLAGESAAARQDMICP